MVADVAVFNAKPIFVRLPNSANAGADTNRIVAK